MIYIVGIQYGGYNGGKIRSIRDIKLIHSESNDIRDIRNKYCEDTSTPMSYKPYIAVIGIYDNYKCFIQNKYFMCVWMSIILNEIKRRDGEFYAKWCNNEN